MFMLIKINILFICKHNRIRSKIAEQIFNMFNKNNKRLKKKKTNKKDY